MGTKAMLTKKIRKRFHCNTSVFILNPYKNQVPRTHCKMGGKIRETEMLEIEIIRERFIACTITPINTEVPHVQGHLRPFGN
jgi:hypothetical protein